MPNYTNPWDELQALARMKYPVEQTQPAAVPQSGAVPQVGGGILDKFKDGTFLSNPYFRFALGVLAGNSGVNQSQAFANAMKGGLAGLDSYDDSQYRQMQALAQQQAANLRQWEFDQKQQQLGAVTRFATSMIEQDPANAGYWGLVAQNPDYGLKMMEAQSRMADREADNARMALALSMRGSGGGSSGGRTSTDYNTYLAVKAAGEIPQDMTYVDYLGTVAGEKRTPVKPYSPTSTDMKENRAFLNRDASESDSTYWGLSGKQYWADAPGAKAQWESEALRIYNGSRAAGDPISMEEARVRARDNVIGAYGGDVTGGTVPKGVKRVPVRPSGGMNGGARTPRSGGNAPSTGSAPPQAEAALRANPGLAPQFKQKYGYLPSWVKSGGF